MPANSKAAILFLFVAILIVASCSSPTLMQEEIKTETPLPTETLVPVTETASPTETITPTPVPQPPLARVQYVMDVQFNFTTNIGTVDQVVKYPNWSGETLNNLVFAVEPNLWKGGFSLTALSIDDQPVTAYVLDGQKLDVQLPRPLQPGGIVTVNMSYKLVLPPMPGYTNPEDVRPQIYGYSGKQTNLVDWYPFIVPYQPGQGWVLYAPWYYGEHLVYDIADFDVTIDFIDGSVPQIASSGAEAVAEKSGSRRFVLEAGRTFALSMSLYYKVASQQIGDVTVYSYYFAFYESAGNVLLQTTVEALQVFSQTFGPYRHRTLTAVQGDFNDGMEFSGLYFISRDYFNLYRGDPKNYLIIIAAHETAHQWWFDGVANDQAREPWLDEALSTYSERIYYEFVHPDLVKWWWGYRYFEFDKPGFVDTSVYDAGGLRTYWDQVYFTGARFLEELRGRVGDETFYAILRDYHNQFAGKRAASADFFRIVHQHTSADISDLMTKYFKDTY